MSSVSVGRQLAFKVASFSRSISFSLSCSCFSVRSWSSSEIWILRSWPRTANPCVIIGAFMGFKMTWNDLKLLEISRCNTNGLRKKTWPSHLLPLVLQYRFPLLIFTCNQAAAASSRDLGLPGALASISCTALKYSRLKPLKHLIYNIIKHIQISSNGT